MIVTLLNGATVDSDNLVFDSTTYHVFNGSQDITLLMRQNDKVIVFPGFSRELDNNRASVELGHGGGVVIGSTSTWDNFWHQIATEPLKAPLDALTKGVSDVWKNPVGKGVIIIGGILLVLYGANTLAKFKDVK